jgi:exopolysaccharide biosynthesis polyprenyl glycosylphosphotransferase
MLLLADVVGLLIAFLSTEAIFHFDTGKGNGVAFGGELLIFLAALPVWVVAAKLAGLYDHDGERAAHSTADEVVSVFHVITAGIWLVWVTSWITGISIPNPSKAATLWALSILLVATSRAITRALFRRCVAYLQNTIIVGAGDVGQLIARKILQHPEYGLNIVGFIDTQPKERRDDLGHLTLLGSPESLAELVRLLDVERVVVAFSNESHGETVELVRSISDMDVQVDVVPRLFDLLTPNVGVHTLEGIPLVSLPPVRLSPSSLLLKRAVDVLGALLGLLITAPLLVVISWRIRRDSPGPVFFRQTRIGMNMREFTALKFRTMHVGTDQAEHHEYIKATMSSSALVGTTGLYKLDRSGAVTPFGAWLRRTSLDELPQLINILRGDMSLVGPRPCLAYEMEHFAQHQFERFLVPAGLTGLWQVKARARSTFGEALDMDVAYARGWSLGLDLRLLLQTPLAVLRQRKTS